MPYMSISLFSSFSFSGKMLITFETNHTVYLPDPQSEEPKPGLRDRKRERETEREREREREKIKNTKIMEETKRV